MRRALLGIAAWLGFWGASAVDAADVVKTLDAKLEGQVTATTPTEVTLRQDDTTKSIPVNQIEWIAFEDEPAALRRARDFVAQQRYEEAAKALDNLRLEEVQRKEIREDIEFFRALSAAKLALEGSYEPAEAEKQLEAFLSTCAQSYHILAANQAAGELFMAAGQFAKAKEHYERVGKAPWPEYKLRAAVAVGQILVAEGKPQDALKYFQYVLDSKGGNQQAAAQRSVALLGKARCLAETGQPDEAIPLAEQVIRQADAEDHELLGRAYLVLGIALCKAGRMQEALFALLRVDTMYSGNREVHAEALYQLIPVWNALKKPDRAQEARRTLTEQYGESRWAKTVPP